MGTMTAHISSGVISRFGLFCRCMSFSRFGKAFIRGSAAMCQTAHARSLCVRSARSCSPARIKFSSRGVRFQKSSGGRWSDAQVW
jgi:hypothetical protein